jgi:signal transduction histidine kinase
MSPNISGRNLQPIENNVPTRSGFCPWLSNARSAIVELEIAFLVMNFSWLAGSSPIRLLLLLEWLLLGVAAIVQMLVAITNPSMGFPFLNMLELGIFATMRLHFPDRWSYKLLYTAIEFGLLLLLTFVGNLPSPSLPYIVLTIRNCVLLAGQEPTQRRVRSIVTLAAFLTSLLSQTHRLLSGRMLLPIPLAQIGAVWIGFAVAFGLVFLFLQLLVDAILAERKGQERLADANIRLRQYALKIEELATVQERNRIARDIHDSLGHSLTVFNIHIGAALRLLHTDPPEAEALLLEVKQLGSQALQEVRQSVSLLRADPLQGRSLQEAVSNLVKEFHKTTSILPTFAYEIVEPLDIELNFTLYRLIQESLTNIYKHAAATEVSISIAQTATEVQAIVRDNGRGFDLDINPSGFGLQGMRERTLALGGRLNITTAPVGTASLEEHQGCQIQAIFPVSGYGNSEEKLR